MNCLQLGDNDKYGHRFNGHDLSNHLEDRGIKSTHLVWDKSLTDKKTIELLENASELRSTRSFFTQLNQTYSSQSIFYPFSYQLFFEKDFLECDVLHMHLIHNYFFDIRDLPLISKIKPVIWTLHDPWALTGHCVHPKECERWKSGCGDCPDLKTDFPIKSDATSLNWELKKIMFQQSDLDIIVASKWMKQMVEQSPFFTNAKIHHIPFGLDLSKFKPMDQVKAKKSLKIPNENIVLALRSTTSEFKGLNHILKILEKLQTEKNITILTFNDFGHLNHLKKKFQIIEMGWVDDDSKMITAYNSTDIFLMPSKAESFGMMAMEAMSCGKVVITMSNTALEEVVMEDQGGGIVVPQGDTNAFLFELTQLIENNDKRNKIGRKALELARIYYNKERYISEIINVYKSAIERKKTDKRAEYISNQLLKFCTSPSNSLLGDLKQKKEILNSVSPMEYQLVLLARKIKNMKIARPIIHQLKKIKLN